jgi:hypothetical protein
MALKISQFTEVERPLEGDYIAVVRNGVNYKAPLPVIKQYFESNVNLYVTKDGDDTTGDGTEANPFLTIQRAINYALKNFYVHQGYWVYINVGPGTYNDIFWLGTRLHGGGSFWVKGDEATPANVVISTTSSCFSAYDGTIALSGVTLTSSSGNCLTSMYAGDVRTKDGVVFGSAPNGWHMISGYGGNLVNQGNFTVTGGSRGLWHGYVSGILGCIGRTITFVNTPNFSYQTACAYCNATLALWSNTFVGSATGQRYNAYMNGSIWTSGLTLPGNAAGTTATGGQYG